MIICPTRDAKSQGQVDQDGGNDMQLLATETVLEQAEKLTNELTR